MKTIDITELMKACGIEHKGTVTITDGMSCLEPNPKDDWLYYGIRAVQEIFDGNERTAASIGEGNGIWLIATLKQYPTLRKAYGTDIVKDILNAIEKNVRDNVPQISTELVFVDGRDCEPLPERVNRIYMNLPLVAICAEEINVPLATTTLTDADAYAHPARDESDPLKRYSMLSQLGALLSAKEKLTTGGIIITMLGGRIPYEITEECFQRAGLEHKLVVAGFKRQSDLQFMRHYAALEEKEGINFDFYDYWEAARIIKERTGFDVPGEIKGYNDGQLKQILAPARLNAKQAFQYYLQGKSVGHIAYGFAAYKPRTDQNASAK